MKDKKLCLVVTFNSCLVPKVGCKRKVEGMHD